MKSYLLAEVLMKPFCLLVALLPFALGCGPSLSDKRTVTLEVGEIVAITVDAVGKERTIKVAATSTGGSIDLHVYLKADEQAIERMITLGKPPENLLGVEEAAEVIAFDVKVPADKEAVVRLQSASRETAEVSVEITAE
ncbi:MAG: hypothetical protein RH917_10510 [Lacipirellulaceae bacterium]